MEEEEEKGRRALVAFNGTVARIFFGLRDEMH